ncbi:MAG TPA: RNA-binding domain-containing protein [Nitrososphaerales archaeon]|nr:RNA-binding domain-containing protein [Nitrososphaerales archaeon]
MTLENFGALEVRAEAEVKKTESKEKVTGALANLFPAHGELKVEDKSVVFISKNIESLRFIKNQFRDRQIRAAARKLLLSNCESSNETTLLLNKQAATVGIAALCDDPRESQLGPIVLKIWSENLEKIIDWLTSGYLTL